MRWLLVNDPMIIADQHCARFLTPEVLCAVLNDVLTETDDVVRVIKNFSRNRIDVGGMAVNEKGTPFLRSVIDM